jgi:glycosyltransferase involved in cell wall biosynthesis
MGNTLTAISACLIVKNEEQMLPRCLSSISEADEIIVCDTGSEDNTVQVAEDFGAKVIYFDWSDDFAAARNFVKNHATNEWILSIDADEFLEPEGMAKIRDSIESCEEDSINLLMKPEGGYGQHNLPRVFRRECNWVGKVHEVIQFPSSTFCDAKITYGYSPAHELDPDIDMRILESIENPIPRDLYYLAREYFYRERWEDAIEMISERYLPVASWMPERADAWLMMARCLWQLNRGEEARTACLQAINNNAHFKEALVFMGEMSWPDNRMMWWKMSEFADNRNVLFVRC